MRIIPKKVKIKNTVWHSWGIVDILIALAFLIVIFILLSTKHYVIMGFVAVVLVICMIPTTDGIFYMFLIDMLKHVFSKKKHVKDEKNAKQSVSALIGLKSINEDGIIKYEGNYYGCVIKVGQKNYAIEDEYQQDTDIQYFGNALKLIEGVAQAEIVKIDRPVNLDGFAEETFRKIRDMEELEDTEANKTKTKLLEERLNRIDNINSITKQYASDYYMVVFEKNEIDVANLALNVATEIAKCGLNTEILTQKQAAVFLKYSFSREFDEHEVDNIPEDKLIDWILPDNVTFTSNSYTIDGTQASILAVADYPLQVRNAWGADVFDIPDTKVVMHLKPVDKFKGIKRIDKCINEMTARNTLAEKASESNSTQTHIESLQELLVSLQNENEALFDVTFTVTAYKYDSENSAYKKKVRKELNLNNMKPSTLYCLQKEGFKSACVSPVETLKNYERSINSTSLAAVFPFVSIFIMDKGGVLLGETTDNAYPFIFNIWKRGNLYQNSNAMIIGQSGGGKSFFMKTLVTNEWANGTRVIMLDPEREYLYLTRNLNGNVIDVGNAQEGRINPFHIYKILTEEGTPASPSVTFNTHLKTLESFFRIVFEGASNDVIELINTLVIKTYERKGITEHTDCSNFKAEDFPLFSDLLDTLLAENKEGLDDLTLRDMRSAELYLQKFVTGRYSDIWNAPSTLQVDADIIDFNFQSLFSQKNTVVANAQMLLIFRFIEQEVINAREANKHGRNLRTLIIVDEAHLFIDAKYPIALDFFYSMNKRIRKYNGAFIPATQNISDWNANEELRGKTSTILKNSQYTFIFKLSPPDMKDVLDIYNTGDSFNEDEQRMIISALRGTAFFIGSTELRHQIRIIAGSYARSIFEDPAEAQKEASMITES